MGHQGGQGQGCINVCGRLTCAPSLPGRGDDQRDPSRLWGGSGTLGLDGREDPPGSQSSSFSYFLLCLCLSSFLSNFQFCLYFISKRDVISVHTSLSLFTTHSSASPLDPRLSHSLRTWLSKEKSVQKDQQEIVLGRSLLIKYYLFFSASLGEKIET